MAPVASSKSASLPSVDISVVVPAYRAHSTIDRCLTSLLNQSFSGNYEILVCASADDASQLPARPQDPRVTILTHVPRLPAAVARNRAAAAARGRLIAFTDADVEAQPDWLEKLAQAADSKPCVAGSVSNGTPFSSVGTAEYLLEFIDLHPARPPAAVHFGATCNLGLERVLWEEVGPFPEDLDGGEDTLLTVALRHRGLFGFAPDAVVNHLNRTGVVPFLRHQYQFGRFTARLARMEGLHAAGPVRATLTRYAALAPVAVAARVGWVYWRLAALDRPLFERSLRCLPAVVAGSLAWGAGLVAERWDELRSGGHRR
jgi:glycosyltransferase involved in cell wall biosynthesis